MWLLLLTQFMRNGTMRLIDAAGGVHVFDGTDPGPTVTLRLHDPALYRKIALNPEFHAGEAGFVANLPVGRDRFRKLTL
jgi:cyclopropane-fatty-acyl-phospholipid synthase